MRDVGIYGLTISGLYLDRTLRLHVDRQATSRARGLVTTDDAISSSSLRRYAVELTAFDVVLGVEKSGSGKNAAPFCSDGGVAERLKAPYSKCGILAKGIGGSNPPPSAKLLV